MTVVAEERRRGPRTRTLLLLALPIALVLSAGIIWQASYATFNATTSDGSNKFDTGTISLTNERSGSAIFNVTNLTPGQTGSACIVVTYDGSVTSNGVHLYIKNGDLTHTGPVATRLGDQLKFTVDEGDGGTYSDCNGFASTATIVTAKPLTQLYSTDQSYSANVGGWAPAAGIKSKTYRFSWVLVSLGTPPADNALLGQSETVTFTWETQS